MSTVYVWNWSVPINVTVDGMVIVAVNKVEPHILNMLDPITDNPDTKVI